MDPRPLEITDLLWSTAANGARRPVAKADVLDQLRARDQRRAVRIVSTLPAADGILVPNTSMPSALGRTAKLAHREEYTASQTPAIHILFAHLMERS